MVSGMFKRLSNPLLSNSLFIFGARGTGKSTLVKDLLSKSKTWVIDLLNADELEHFSLHPQALAQEALARKSEIEWILVDEVQKLPKLLDVVHSIMENHNTRHIKFALTGSSARKLKIVGANLLAGRAFVNEFYPLTYRELGDQFDLLTAVNFGTLPKISSLNSDLERKEYLRTYSRTYLKEEVWDERLVQNLDPFRKFLEVAAQSNGTIVNYSNVAKQTGVDDKTVKKYFEILADTFLGFYLESYHKSVRAQQILSPKFYLFDTGVKRSMEGMLNVPVAPRTYSFGRAFEHFILCECHRLNSYLRLDYKFSYLKTKSDLEIDLIIERPGQSIVIVEIKSTDASTEDDTSVLKQFIDDFPDAIYRVWSNDHRSLQYGDIKAVHWEKGLAEVF
jgi:predicted AAA+ superfamily ATPase